MGHLCSSSGGATRRTISRDLFTAKPPVIPLYAPHFACDAVRMKFTSDKAQGNIIRSFKPGEIHLRDQVLTTNVIIGPEHIFPDWQPARFEDLSIADFQIALDQHPDIILFGAGATQRFLDIAVTTEIMRSGVAIEVMPTDAACRTFNILIAENRAAVAALLID